MLTATIIVVLHKCIVPIMVKISFSVITKSITINIGMGKNNFVLLNVNISKPLFPHFVFVIFW